MSQITASNDLFSVAQCRPALGTYVKVSIQGAAPERELLAHSLEAFEEIERIERLMSFHDPQSELSRINREACHRRVPMSDDTNRVLTEALRLSARSEGLFDPTVAPELVKLGSLPDHGLEVDPSASWRDIRIDSGEIFFDKHLQIDLGGIAKGYAVDRAFEKVPAEFEVTINAGGDLRMRPWHDQTVGVRVPGDCGLVNIPMFANAIATSSGEFFEEGHPVICPKRRSPICDPRSLSVFAPTCMLADALTKVLFLSPDPSELLHESKALAVEVNEKAEVFLIGVT